VVTFPRALHVSPGGLARTAARAASRRKRDHCLAIMAGDRLSRRFWCMLHARSLAAGRAFGNGAPWVGHRGRKALETTLKSFVIASRQAADFSMKLVSCGWPTIFRPYPAGARSRPDAADRRRTARAGAREPTHSPHRTGGRRSDYAAGRLGAAHLARCRVMLGSIYCGHTHVGTKMHLRETRGLLPPGGGVCRVFSSVQPGTAKRAVGRTSWL